MALSTVCVRQSDTRQLGIAPDGAAISGVAADVTSLPTLASCCINAHLETTNPTGVARGGEMHPLLVCE